MNTELEAFALEVQKAAMQIVGAAGGTGRAAELALTLADRATAVRQGEKMKGEQEAGDAFNLKALRVNLNDSDPSEPHEARLQE